MTDAGATRALAQLSRYPTRRKQLALVAKFADRRSGTRSGSKWIRRILPEKAAHLRAGAAEYGAQSVRVGAVDGAEGAGQLRSLQGSEQREKALGDVGSRAERGLVSGQGQLGQPGHIVQAAGAGRRDGTAQQHAERRPQRRGQPTAAVDGHPRVKRSQQSNGETRISSANRVGAPAAKSRGRRQISARSVDFCGAGTLRAWTCGTTVLVAAVGSRRRGGVRTEEAAKGPAGTGGVGPWTRYGQYGLRR